MGNRRIAVLGGALALALGLASCGGDSVPLRGTIEIDGAATIAPLTKAIAKRFTAEHPGVRISVGSSGTAAGLAKLCRGAVDVGEAAGPVGASATRACGRASTASDGVLVAHDAVVLVIAPQTPVRCLTTRQLTQIWHRNSDVTDSWSQVHDLDPPYGGPMTAWGPGTDTEEFAFFNESVNGRRDSYRDYNNTLHRPADVIPGVLSPPGNLGYVEYRHFRTRDRAVRAIAIDSGDGCVSPAPAAIASGRYRPLSRRLLLFPSARALARPAVAEFARFYLDHVREIAPRAGFVPPTDGQLDASRARLDRLIAAAGG